MKRHLDGSATLYSPAVRHILLIILSSAAAGCSDAGTRVAYDLEYGVTSLGTQEGTLVSIKHTPRSWPGGCSEGYTLYAQEGSRLDEPQSRPNGRGRLGVKCDGGGGGSTTYHRRFLDVADDMTVKKGRGEEAILEVERRGGRAVLIGLR